MNLSFNRFSVVLLLLSFGILFSSCRTAEEIVEPESEPEITVEVTEPAQGPEPEPEPESESVDELHTVNFNFDRDTITDRAAMLLAQNVEELRASPNTRVRVDAYTDHVGGDQYNLRLSLRRAASVVSFYTSNGIDESRIDSRGLGKAPIPCAEAEMDRNTPGCEKNRRAESHPLNRNR